jgi:hypothetical protein
MKNEIAILEKFVKPPPFARSPAAITSLEFYKKIDQGEKLSRFITNLNTIG